MTNLFTFVVLLESSPAKYNFEIIYFVLILLTSIFTLLPYIRNLIHGILLIVISFLLFIFTLLYLDYEFVAVLILILYVGSILLIILYVIAILNNGVLLDSSLFKAYSIER
jgi:NADH:ubiquinone oxidoreductase subunit 6 (subunit J)